MLFELKKKQSEIVLTQFIFIFFGSFAFIKAYYYYSSDGFWSTFDLSNKYHECLSYDEESKISQPYISFHAWSAFLFSLSVFYLVNNKIKKNVWIHKYLGRFVILYWKISIVLLLLNHRMLVLLFLKFFYKNN